MLLTENCFNGNRKLSMRSGRAGPSFSVRPEKEAKGAVSDRCDGRLSTGTSAAESVDARSNPFGEPSQTCCAFAESACSQRLQTHGRATQSDAANAALAFRQRSALHLDAGYGNDSQRGFCALFSSV